MTRVYSQSKSVLWSKLPLNGKIERRQPLFEASPHFHVRLRQSCGKLVTTRLSAQCTSLQHVTTSIARHVDVEVLFNENRFIGVKFIGHEEVR